MYLTDDDLITMLNRCKDNLTADGCIIVKENIYDHVNDQGAFTVDNSDNSVIRSTEHFKEIFKKAGLKVIKEEK